MRRTKLPVRRDRRGVATLEFAAALPLVMLMMFGFMDIARLVRGNTRAHSTAMQIGQIVSQCQQINGGDADVLRQMAEAILGSYAANNARWELRVNAFGQDSTGRAIQWSMPPIAGGTDTPGAPLSVASKGAAVPAGYVMGSNRLLFRTEVFVSMDKTFFSRMVSPLVRSTWGYSTVVSAFTSVRAEAVNTTRVPNTDTLRTNTGSKGCLT